MSKSVFTKMKTIIVEHYTSLQMSENSSDYSSDTVMARTLVVRNAHTRKTTT